MGRLVKCPDCGESVSRKAAACPSCGRGLKKKSSCGCLSGVFGLFVLGFLIVLVLAPKTPRPAADISPPLSQVSLLPEVATFLAEHPEFGPVDSTYSIPDWAKGPRQGLHTTDGRTLVIYIKGGKVAAVHNKSGAGELLWGEEEKD